MEKRKSEVENLKHYTQRIEDEVTLILQNLQWDSKHLLKDPALSVCKYDRNHKLPSNKQKIHEEKCYLKCEGYTKQDLLLPEPLDCKSSSLVKLSTHKISEIINNAAKLDPLFKKGCEDTVPLTMERLQYAYSADERRAIHDAVVEAAPSCHDLTDLALLSTHGENGKGSKTKSRMEILAELRDMKRRRTKYRVAAKTKNYSDVLRDVIKTQMEVYTESYVEDSTSKSQGNNWRNNSNLTKTNECYNNRGALDDRSKNPVNNKIDGRSDTVYYKNYKDAYSQRKKPESHINTDCKKDHKKHDKIRRVDERKYEKDKNYYDQRNSSGSSDSRFRNEKQCKEKGPSDRDTEGKRYEDRRSSTSKRYRDDDKRKYDRYYRHEQSQKDDRTPPNKTKRYDEIKKR